MVLTPAYDLLSTSVRFPNETRTALELFRDFKTPQFAANGFYTLSDFRELGKRFKLPAKSVEAVFAEFQRSHPAVESLVNLSFLSPPAKMRYIKIVADRAIALKIGSLRGL